MSFLTLFSTQAWGQNISMYCLPLLHLGDWTDDAEKVTDQIDSVNIGCYLRTSKGELKPLLNPGPKALFLSDLAAALGSSSPTGTARGLSPLPPPSRLFNDVSVSHDPMFFSSSYSTAVLSLPMN